MMPMAKALRRILRTAFVTFVVIDIHLFAAGLYLGRWRARALFGGALLLGLLASAGTTIVVVRNTLAFYAMVTVALVAGGVALAAAGLIAAALADDRPGMEEASGLLLSCLGRGFVVLTALGVVGGVLGLGRADLPRRRARGLGTADAIQRAVLDRLAAEWRRGR